MRRLLVCLLCAQAYLYIPWLGLYEPIGLVPIVSHEVVDPVTGETVVVREYDTSQLGDGIGRAEGLTWGRTDGGRTVIFGHSYGAFAPLDTLQVGDQILIYLNWSEPPLDFRVIQIGTVPVEYGDYLFNTPVNEFELDLITCYGDRRLIVRAKLVTDE